MILRTTHWTEVRAEHNNTGARVDARGWIRLTVPSGQFGVYSVPYERADSVDPAAYRSA
jgi:hypothetical protein